MSGFENFKRRKEVIKDSKLIKNENIDVDENLKKYFLNSDFDFNSMNKIDRTMNKAYSFDFNVSVSDEEVEELLSSIRKEYDDTKFDNLIQACKKDVISSIIGPFGLGGLVSKGDKDGGNVTTINNAQNGVYAEDKDKYTRSDYTETKNSLGQKFKGDGKNSIGSELLNLIQSGTVIPAKVVQR